VLLHSHVAVALRDLTVAIARCSGVPLLVAGSEARGSRNLRADEIGILATTTEGGRRRVNRYVMTLTRWHANLVVLPPLALSVGRIRVPGRLLILAVGLPAVFFFDALAAFAYLLLARGRLGGVMFVSPLVHRNLAHGIAAVGLKILPIAVWAALFVLVRRYGPAGAGPRRPAGRQE
jgi:hypothetical protein